MHCGAHPIGGWRPRPQSAHVIAVDRAHLHQRAATRSTWRQVRLESSNARALRQTCSRSSAPSTRSHPVSRSDGPGLGIDIDEETCRIATRVLSILSPRPEVVRADMMDLDRVVAESKGHDLVWHMAANTDIIGSHTQPDRDLRDCVVATFNTSRNSVMASTATGIDAETVMPTLSTR